MPEQSFEISVWTERADRLQRFCGWAEPQRPAGVKLSGEYPPSAWLQNIQRLNAAIQESSLLGESQDHASVIQAFHLPHKQTWRYSAGNILPLDLSLNVSPHFPLRLNEEETFYLFGWWKIIVLFSMNIKHDCFVGRNQIMYSETEHSAGTVCDRMRAVD